VVPFMQLPCTADGPLASVCSERDRLAGEAGGLQAGEILKSRERERGGDVMRAVRRDWKDWKEI